LLRRERAATRTPVLAKLGSSDDQMEGDRAKEPLGLGHRSRAQQTKATSRRHAGETREQEERTGGQHGKLKKTRTLLQRGDHESVIQKRAAGGPLGPPRWPTPDARSKVRARPARAGRLRRPHASHSTASSACWLERPALPIALERPWATSASCWPTACASRLPYPRSFLC